MEGDTEIDEREIPEVYVAIPIKVQGVEQLNTEFNLD